MPVIFLWRPYLKFKDCPRNGKSSSRREVQSSSGLEKAHLAFEEARQRAAQERIWLQPAIELGHSKLAELRQHLLNARQQVEQATGALSQAEAQWAQTGLNQAHFKTLEVIDQKIQAGQQLSNLPTEHQEVSPQDKPEIFSTVDTLKQSEDRLQELYLKRQELQYLQALTEGTAIREQLSATDQAAAEVARCAEEVAQWEAWASFPVHLHQDVIRLATQRSRFQRECDQGSRISR